MYSIFQDCIRFMIMQCIIYFHVIIISKDDANTGLCSLECQTGRLQGLE